MQPEGCSRCQSLGLFEPKLLTIGLQKHCLQCSKHLQKPLYPPPKQSLKQSAKQVLNPCSLALNRVCVCAPAYLHENHSHEGKDSLTTTLLVAHEICHLNFLGILRIPFSSPSFASLSKCPRDYRESRQVAREDFMMDEAFPRSMSST